jgi:HEAT repeat protein
MPAIQSIRSLCALIVLAGCALAAYCALRHTAPAYNGRSLDSWLEDLDSSYPSGLRGERPWQADLSARQMEAATAVRAMGAGALPRLKQDLKSKNSDSRLWRDRARGLFVKNVEPLNVYDLQRRAIFGLAALGKLAKPAIPDLSKCLTTPAVASHAAAALASIDPDGWEALFRGLHSSNNIVFTACASAVGDYRIESPAIIQCLMSHPTNGPAEMAVRSLRALSVLGETNRQIIEFISGRLKSPDAEIRAYTAFCLLRIGESATNSLPDLQRLLDDRDPRVREAAAGAIRVIGRYAE